MNRWAGLVAILGVLLSPGAVSAQLTLPYVYASADSLPGRATANFVTSGCQELHIWVDSAETLYADLTSHDLSSTDKSIGFRYDVEDRPSDANPDNPKPLQLKGSTNVRDAYQGPFRGRFQRWSFYNNNVVGGNSIVWRVMCTAGR